ncbi:MAG: NUDIX domain-containing protein [Alphaproteobacteria bacterium]|nr:MAG: NUDIX domain-containing protein [Alphaproteobacteria bacterium]
MTDNKEPQAKIVSRRNVYKGFFTVEELDIEMDRFDGGTQLTRRLNFERGNAVAILAYDPARDEVIMINEIRPPMLVRGDNPFNDSLSAGMIDDGETAVEAAVREMHEETGQELKNPVLIHPGLYASAGGTSEKIALVMGFVDTSLAGGIHGEASEGENIKTVVVKADEFIARAEDGRLMDMKSIACAHWLAVHRDELRKGVTPDETPLPPPPPAKKLNAKILNRQDLSQGVFKIEMLEIEMDKHEGGTQTLKRLNFERGDAVAVIGYDRQRDEILMIRELRSGILAAGENPFTDTLPAAMAGGDPLTTAVGLMDRKTGSTLKDAKLVHAGAYVSAGGTSEKIALVVGEVDTSKGGGLNGSAAKAENILTVVVSAEEFLKRAEEGRVNDMKTFTMAQWFAKHRDEFRPEVTPEATATKTPPAKKISYGPGR